ncbi:VOC family protein [Ruminiclostridium herbifermentans]|uniref:VOC family protein n=1 Tax=Ruminiclostridium herbifermentans TaxID=2488810 RepID=A0A4U7JC13_9FIRM|nr:VOC family protein [Ruminiclostridium herbifermentans]QNU65883.1 VOC family protein [Ruminiclostridium herbifermentans]
MKSHISHIALYVKDIERAREFYMKYFDGKSNEKYINSKGFQSYFITFSSGARMEIMAHSELVIRENMEKVNGWSHIAFSVGSEENVRTLTQQIVADGYELLSPVRYTGDGYYESCVSDPEGNRVEITV